MAQPIDFYSCLTWLGPARSAPAALEELFLTERVTLFDGKEAQNERATLFVGMEALTERVTLFFEEGALRVAGRLIPSPVGQAPPLEPQQAVHPT